MNELLLDYLPLVIFIGVALVISLVLLLVPFVVAYQAPDPEKLSAYECGFNAFDDARMHFQTKPLLISGVEAFWSGKTGQLHVRKGRTWVTLQVGGAPLQERDINDARKLGEILAKKL